MPNGLNSWPASRSRPMQCASAGRDATGRLTTFSHSWNFRRAPRSSRPSSHTWLRWRKRRGDDAGDPQEILFGLHSGWAGAGGCSYQNRKRAQRIVRPINHHDPALSHAIVEIHSHHRMAARFSPTDDRDETSFKLYGVSGRPRHGSPTLQIAGRYLRPSPWEIPASSVLSSSPKCA